MLNVFRVLGDLSHLLSILILLHKMTQLKVGRPREAVPVAPQLTR